MGVGGGGGRGQYTVITRRMGCDENHFNASVIVMGKVT